MTPINSTQLSANRHHQYFEKRKFSWLSEFVRYFGEDTASDHIRKNRATGQNLSDFGSNNRFIRDGYEHW